jgi:hypothetical protein
LTGIDAQLNTGFTTEVSSAVDSVAASAVMSGNRFWTFDMRPHVTVTNPSITLNSGFSPAALKKFDLGSQQIGSSLSSLPYTVWTQASAGEGGGFCCSGVVSTNALNQAFGFDSSRTVNALTIPVEGTTQSVTVTVT